jgi:tetratricopeptide (TPR) repeat protein
MAKYTSQQQNKGGKAKMVSKPLGKQMEIIATPKALKRLRNVLGIIIAVFAFVLYAQSISFNYTLDDGTVLRENKVTKKGISGIPEIMKHGYWYGFNQSKEAAYRPTSLIMFAMEWQLFDDNPHASHLINILLYSLSCWLLFLLLCRLFEKQNLLFPFVCTLLYVAHPIHTEVVDSIKSRDEILCFLFGIVSLLCLIRYNNTKFILGLVFGVISFFLCLLSKETGIAFLVIIPLTLFVFTATDIKKVLTVSAGLLVFTGVYLFLRSQILDSITTSHELMAIDNTLMDAKDFTGREATAFYILLKYVFLLIIPHPLSYDYSFAQIKIQTLGDPGALVGILLYVAMGIYAVINIRKKSLIAYAILIYLLTLSPVSNVFLIIGSTMAERFMYIPSLGFCIVLTWMLIKITKVESVKSKFGNVKQFFSANSSVMVIVIIIVGLYSIKTYTRSQDWKGNVELFGHDVETADNSARAHYNWGSALLLNLYPKEKNKDRQSRLLDSAIIEFTKANSIFNNYSDCYMNMALAYTDKTDLSKSNEEYKMNNQKAIETYEIANKLYGKPNAKLYNNLGMLYGKANQFEKALSILDSAIKYDEDNAEAHNNRGNALAGLGRYKEALPEFEKAVSINKKYAEAYRNIGSTYGNLKVFDKALENFKIAYSYDSTDAQTVYFMGYTHQSMGDTVVAKQYFEKFNRMKTEQQK